VKHIADSPNFGRLKVLNLATNRIGKFGVEALANSRNLAHLTALNLGGDESPKKEREFSALASSPFLSRLKSIELEGNCIGDARLIEIFRSPNLARITVLNVNGNEMTLAGLRVLLGSCFVTRLRSLNIGWNGMIGLAGARMLSDAKELANLRELNVRYCNVHPKGISALLASPHLRRLKMLDVEGNRIGEGDRNILLQRFGKGKN
jgi:hypothetical protein